MNEIIELLKQARAKIDGGWCMGANARDEHGKPVNANDKTACSWCIVGVTYAVSTPLAAHQLQHELVLSESLEEYNYQLSSFNDHPGTTKDKVLALFTETIERLEKQYEEAGVA